MKNKYYWLLILLVFFGCNSKSESSSNQDDNVVKHINDNAKNTDKLLKDAINEGISTSYDKAASLYFNDNRYNDFYFYAMMMANKHNYPRAYYDLYTIMTRKGLKINEIEMYSNDEITLKFSNYFLLKSYELGLTEAKTDLKRIFGENIPSSEEYLCDSK